MINQLPGGSPDRDVPPAPALSLTRAEFDALVVELRDDGNASVGRTVHVADDAGRTTEYRLVRRRRQDAHRHEVSPGSPVGQALIGTATGDVVRVELPGGRVRELRVFPTPSNDPAAERAA